MHRDRGGLPARACRGPGAADSHRDVERRCRHHPQRRAVRRRARPHRSSSTTAAPPPSRSVTGRVPSTGSTCRPARSLPGWGSGAGDTVGPGQGCQSNPSGGTPATGVNGVEVPGSPPVDSTASVDASNGDLYFGAGNAASPVDGGYYAYAPNGTEVWNQVVTNPATDNAPDGGVQASLPIADGGSLVEGGSLGQETYALNTAQRHAGHGVAAVLRRQRVLHRRRGRLLRHGLGRLRRRRGVVGRVRPRDALLRRRARPDLQRPRRPDLQRQHDRGGRLLPRRRPASCPGGAYGIATGTGTFYPGATRREHRQGLRHQVQPGLERHARRLDGGQPRAGRRAGQRPARRRRGHGHGRRLPARCTRSTPRPAPSSGRRTCPAPSSAR